MANISSLLEIIRTAHLGRDMRQALHDSIQAVNNDTETALGKSLTFTNATRKLSLKANDGTVLSEATIPGGGSGGGSVDSVNGVAPDENGNVQLTATDVGAMSSSAALNDISDVTLSSPSNGQVLGYDGSKWKNMDAPSSGGGHTIKNESGTALTQRDNLQFKGCSVSDDSTNNATVVSVQTSNRNLLDNAWFTVNQKGFTTTSSSGKLLDRWATKYTQSGNSFTLNSDNSFTISNPTTSSAGIYQGIENLSQYVGKQLTLSIMYGSNNNIFSYTFTYANASSTYSDGFSTSGDYRVALALYGSDNQVSIYCRKNFASATDTSVTIKAVKLELGSTSTLAFDTAPDYTTELLKCQRYLYPLGGKSFNAMVSALQQTRQWLTITLPTEMRAVPTFSGSLTTEGISGSTRVENTVTSSNITVTKTQDIEFNFTTSSNYNLCSCARVSFASGSYLSAEL